MGIKFLLIASFLMFYKQIGCSLPNEGCISRKAFQTATLQDEMDISFCRRGKDVKITIEHSNGTCVLRVRDSKLNDKWIATKLTLKETIALSINASNPMSVGTCEDVPPNTIKKISIESAHLILPNCIQGPAIYQVGKVQESAEFPWYKEEVHLKLKPLVDTQINIQAGGKKFVLCSNGTLIALYEHQGSNCTGGAGTSEFDITVPETNDWIKVKTIDGNTTTQIENGNQDLVKIFNVQSGTVIINQCLPQCEASNTEAGEEDGTAFNVQNDTVINKCICQCETSFAEADTTSYSCSMFIGWMVFFIVLSVGLVAALVAVWSRGGFNFIKNK